MKRRPKQSKAPARAERHVGNVENIAKDHDRCARQCRDRVQVRTQHLRDFGEKDVACHAAADSGQHAEKRGHYRVESEVDRLLRTGHGEERQPRRIEQQNRIAQSVDAGVPEERDDTRQHGNQKVAHVRQRTGRHRADQYVSANPAEVSRDERQDQDAEDVQPTVDRCYRPADREDEGADEIENTHDRGSVDHACRVRERATRRRDAAPFGAIRLAGHLPNRCNSDRIRQVPGRQTAQLAPSQASVPTTKASIPVSRVGCRTGANFGLWLTGSSFSLPAAFALA